MVSCKIWKREYYILSEHLLDERIVKPKTCTWRRLFPLTLYMKAKLLLSFKFFVNIMYISKKNSMNGFNTTFSWQSLYNNSKIKCYYLSLSNVLTLITLDVLIKSFETISHIRVILRNKYLTIIWQFWSSSVLLTAEFGIDFLKKIIYE